MEYFANSVPLSLYTLSIILDFEFFAKISPVPFSFWKVSDSWLPMECGFVADSNE